MKESKEKQCHQRSQEERDALYAKMLHNLERTRADVKILLVRLLPSWTRNID